MIVLCSFYETGRAHETPFEVAAALANLYGESELQIAELTTRSRGGASRSVLTQFIRATRDNDRMLLLRSQEPAELRGLAYLSMESAQDDIDLLYVYLPEVRVVRRISTASQRDPILGTALSYEDLRFKSISDFRVKQIASSDGECSVFSLTPVSAFSSSYDEYRVCIARELTFKWIELREQGRVAKRIDLDQETVSLIDGRHFSRSMIVYDFLRELETHVSTQLLLSGFSLPRRVFSVQNLQRGSSQRDLDVVRPALNAGQRERLDRFLSKRVTNEELSQ